MATQFVCYPHLWKMARNNSPAGILPGLTCFDRPRVKTTTPAELSAKETDILCFRFAEEPADEDDVEVIKTFTHVKELQLEFNISSGRRGSIFAHFLNLPLETVKSLTLISTRLRPPSQAVFNFICSFPNLEYLRIGDLISNGDDWHDFDTPTNLDKPKLTGTFVYEGERNFARNFPHRQTVFGFREIIQRRVPDPCFSGVRNLVEACSDTIKCIRIHGCKSSSDHCEIGPVSDQVFDLQQLDLIFQKQKISKKQNFGSIDIVSWTSPIHSKQSTPKN